MLYTVTYRCGRVRSSAILSSSPSASYIASASAEVTFCRTIGKS